VLKEKKVLTTQGGQPRRNPRRSREKGNVPTPSCSEGEEGRSTLSGRGKKLLPRRSNKGWFVKFLPKGSCAMISRTPEGKGALVNPMNACRAATFFGGGTSAASDKGYSPKASL